MMNDEVKQALGKDRVIDMTTIGRTSGEPRRKETWFHNIAGQVYLTGTPGKRDWYANMVANPAFTFHLKESVTADLAAQARPVTEPGERRTVLARILSNIGRPASDLPAWEAGSPLVAVTFDDA
jgi:deazaflavin-dependent oxidoreductase (nitroreductase family)